MYLQKSPQQGNGPKQENWFPVYGLINKFYKGLMTEMTLFTLKLNTLVWGTISPMIYCYFDRHTVYAGIKASIIGFLSMHTFLTHITCQMIGHSWVIVQERYGIKGHKTSHHIHCTWLIAYDLGLMQLTEMEKAYTSLAIKILKSLINTNPSISLLA